MAQTIFAIVLLSFGCTICFACCDGFGDPGVGASGIPAAIITTGHSVHRIPHFGDGGNGRMTVVDVESGIAPVAMRFHSRSSPVLMAHSHRNLGGSFHKSFSMDGPQKMLHVVHKPVHKHLMEIIAPHNSLRQVIKPVVKTIETSVFGHDEQFGFH